jgi:hypothetical protein
MRVQLIPHALRDEDQHDDKSANIAATLQPLGGGSIAQPQLGQ